MKVLHVYKTYYPDTVGGVEKFIDQLIQSIQPMGVTSEVFALTRRRSPESFSMNGYQVNRAHQNIEIASSPFSISAIFKFKKLAKEADIIHYHFPWPFADMLHFIAGIKKPCIVTYHSDVVKQKFLLKLYNPLMHSFLSSVNCIAPTSPNYVATSNVLNQYHDKIRVVPIGIDKNSYPVPSPEKLAHWQREFPTPFFLFIGNLRYYKGVQFLVEAANQVDAPIVIVGPMSTAGPELKKMSKPSNIHFLDEVSEEDKVALLMLCYGLVMPSHLRSEAFGIALLEGAMYGKPLISCEIGTGTTFVNMANETGLVVPPRDPLALAEAMNNLLANPSSVYAMGKHAQYRFDSMFTADRMAKSYLELYQEVLKAHA